jgi:hypothetical protein
MTVRAGGASPHKRDELHAWPREGTICPAHEAGQIGVEMSHRLAIRSASFLVAAMAAMTATAGPALAGTASHQPASTGHGQGYLAASSLAFADVVINPASTLAYFTVPSENEVAVLNLATHKYAKPIPVGSDPHGIDITADGKTLYVADSGGQTISQVTIATSKVKTIETPSSFDADTPFSIVTLDNNTALYSTTFAGSGFGGSLYSLSLMTGVSTLVSTAGINGEVTEDTLLSRNASHSVASAVLGDDSGGPFDIYTAATGGVVSGTDNAFIWSGALSGTGHTLLAGGYQAATVVAARTGTILATISITGWCYGSALSAGGGTGYCLTPTSISVLNINRFLQASTIALPSGATGNAGDAVTVSPNGKTLIAETSAGPFLVSV